MSTIAELSDSLGFAAAESFPKIDLGIAPFYFFLGFVFFIFLILYNMQPIKDW